MTSHRARPCDLGPVVVDRDPRSEGQVEAHECGEGARPESPPDGVVRRPVEPHRERLADPETRRVDPPAVGEAVDQASRAERRTVVDRGLPALAEALAQHEPEGLLGAGDLDVVGRSAPPDHPDQGSRDADDDAEDDADVPASARPGETRVSRSTARPMARSAVSMRWVPAANVIGSQPSSRIASDPTVPDDRHCDRLPVDRHQVVPAALVGAGGQRDRLDAGDLDLGDADRLDDRPGGVPVDAEPFADLGHGEGQRRGHQRIERHRDRGRGTGTIRLDGIQLEPTLLPPIGRERDDRRDRVTTVGGDHERAARRRPPGGRGPRR